VSLVDRFSLFGDLDKATGHLVARPAGGRRGIPADLVAAQVAPGGFIKRNQDKRLDGDGLAGGRFFNFDGVQTGGRRGLPNELVNRLSKQFAFQ
jgi:hypothetical protein